MADTGKWITVKGRHVYLEDDSEDSLYKALRESFIDKDSYVNDPEYDKNVKEIGRLNKESAELGKQISDLRDVIEKETVISDDDIAMFGGDRNLAKLFATVTEKGMAAKGKLAEVQKAKDKITENLESLSASVKRVTRQENAKQKAEFDKNVNSLKEAGSKDYTGFQKDTHTPKYQDLLEKGKARVVEMTPQQYLQYCAYKVFDSTYERQVIAAIADAKHTMDLAKLMQNGTKMYCPVLDFKSREQEGRHRALAAMILGIDKIPVTVVE